MQQHHLPPQPAEAASELPAAAASAGAVAAAGDPMMALSSGTEPELLVKPGSGDPLREARGELGEEDEDGLMGLVGQGEEDDPLSAAALQSLIMPSPPTTFFLPASLSTAAAAAPFGPSPPIPQHPATAAAAAALAGSSGGSGTGTSASLLVAAAAAAAAASTAVGAREPPIGAGGLEGVPSSFPHAGAAAAMLEPPPVRSNDRVMVAASGGAAGAADFLLMPPPPPRGLSRPTTGGGGARDASAVPAAEEDADGGVGRFQPGRARSSSDSFGQMGGGGGGGGGMGGNGGDGRSKRHAPLGQWITPPQPQYESGWGGLLRKTHSEQDMAGMASSAGVTTGIPIGGPHHHHHHHHHAPLAPHHNPFLAPPPDQPHQQPQLSSSAPTSASLGGGRGVGSRLRSLLPSSWRPNGGGITTAGGTSNTTAGGNSSSNRRKRDDAATATTASAASTSSSLSSPPSPPSEHQPAMPTVSAAHGLPRPPHVGSIGRSFSFPHSLRSMGSNSGSGDGGSSGGGQQAGSTTTRPPAFLVSEDALAWPAPGPIAIPGATEPSTAAGNSSSSSSSNNGGMGRGIGGMRRELSYPDIAGMSLSSSPSTNSVLAAAAASSVSPSLRPRRRSGSGGGAAAMLSTQQQQPHQQILPSPYGASPGGSFGASPSLPSPLQALGGRAPTTQEERRQLRLAKNRAWGRLRRLRARNLTSLYEAGLQEMEEELAALQAHRWGEGHSPEAVWTALGRPRCLRLPAPAEAKAEANAVLGRLRGQLECVGRQAAVLEGLGRALTGDASGFAEPELLAVLELSPAQAAQAQAILCGENEDAASGVGPATALVGQAGQRLAALRARLLESSSSAAAAGGGVHPPLLQAVVDAAPAVLEPEQALRALEWLDANREGVAALPCLPAEAEVENGVGAEGPALFHFSSAEDTPLLQSWGGGAGPS